MLKNKEFQHLTLSLGQLLLFPFTLIYKAITDFRNHLYNIEYKKSTSFDRYVISVGNLTAGGTGKTPFVELLIRNLKNHYQTAVLSRGYKRRTKGFRLANNKDNASTLGDEPYQYYRKFGTEINVAVGEDRALAIPEILFKEEKTEVIVLDDAFQHRRVKPDLNFLINEYGRPFYRDYVLPSGMLRESRKNASRADMIIVTKCPEDLSIEKMSEIEIQIRKYSGPKAPIYFAAVRYLEPKGAFDNIQLHPQVFLLTGIGNPEPLVQYVKTHFKLIGHKAYPDHHDFTAKELKDLEKSIRSSASGDFSILTTEKDMVRLLSSNQQFLESLPVFYLPIELYFLKNGDFFVDNLIKDVEKGLASKSINRYS